VTRNEEKIKTIFKDLTRIERDQLAAQERQAEAIESINAQIKQLANDQYHELLAEIEVAKNTRRSPFGRIEWGGIILAVISGAIGIIRALIEAGVI
jgi:hypothetical protein